MNFSWKQRQNFFSLNTKEYIQTNNINLKFLADILNKEKLVILSWLRNIWKLNFIKEFINKTWSSINYFYLNKSNDNENIIKTNKDLNTLLNDYVQLYKNPKIIILQNISNIEWVKKFISKIYKLNYKVIIIWNDIQISGIKEIEILNSPKINNQNIENIIKYWSLNDARLVQTKYLKEKILKLITNDIFLNDIFKKHSVKSIDLYNQSITYLAKNNIFLSLRDLQKNIELIQWISLKTTIDYIDFSLQAKIIKRCYRYDIKTKKEISSKAKYYFTDNWIRNSLSQFKLEKNILIENLIFNKLQYNKYKIYSGLNWTFYFTFYWKKKNENIFIHISKQTTKEEIKKEINKLNKIKKDWKKYLLVENLEKLGIKKVQYDNVEIMEILEFLEIF